MPFAKEGEKCLNVRKMGSGKKVRHNVLVHYYIVLWFK